MEGVSVECFVEETLDKGAAEGTLKDGIDDGSSVEEGKKEGIVVEGSTEGELECDGKDEETGGDERMLGEEPGITLSA